MEGKDFWVYCSQPAGGIQRTGLPVEVSLDSLLDQPEGMMGLVVQVSPDLGQDLGRDVGEVVSRVRESQHLHRVLTRRPLRGGALRAEAPAPRRPAIGYEL